MEKHVFEAALAGLMYELMIHPAIDWGDLGSQLVPLRWKPATSPDSEMIALARTARQLASPERPPTNIVAKAPESEKLHSIFESVQLLDGTENNPGIHNLLPLDLNDSVLFPTSTATQGSYKKLLDGFTHELRSWKSATSDWEEQQEDAYYVTLMALLRKYFWCVPSAIDAGRNEQTSTSNVPMYEQIRLTSAITACLAADNWHKPSATEKQPKIALILRGDVSGIQNFIYRITSPGAETEHVAKRLRGRSFYLSILVEVVADWILRSLGMPPSCALFVGGGRFDLLLPLNALEQIQPLKEMLQDWLLQQFEGELSIHMVHEAVSEQDLCDMSGVYMRLDRQLEHAKTTNWSSKLQSGDFYEPGDQKWHVCRICQLTPLPEPGVCLLCRQHEYIGANLPYATDLVWTLASNQTKQSGQAIQFNNAPFDVMVWIARSREEVRDILDHQKVIRVVHLNNTAEFVLPDQPGTFAFLANAAPTQGANVLDFQSLAKLSRGAQRIGILKADADFLGLVMSEGLRDVKKGLAPTITRVSALSSALDLFFAGYLNCICQKVSKRLVDKAGIQLNGQIIPQLFYVMYSGGDDLFLVGPWDAVLELAQELNAEFHRYTNQNLSLSLSAGYVQVKPDYPVHKFSELVDEAEKKAKNYGRNRITLFDIAVPWTAEVNGFNKLWNLSMQLVQFIESKELPRGLVAELGRTFRMHNTGPNSMNVMWTPRLHYILTRRVKKEIFEQIKPDIFSAMRGCCILAPVSITSLMTRKE